MQYSSFVMIFFNVYASLFGKCEREHMTIMASGLLPFVWREARLVDVCLANSARSLQEFMVIFITCFMGVA